MRVDGLTSDWEPSDLWCSSGHHPWPFTVFTVRLRSLSTHAYADGLQIYVQVDANNPYSNPKQYKAEQSKMNSLYKQNIKGHL